MAHDRVDLYNEIHKGLRRALCAWVGRLGRLDAENATEVARARAEFAELTAMLAAHAAHEERWVHPLLAACAPGLLDDLERDHAALDSRLDAVTEALDRLADGNAESPWMLQHEAYQKFADFCGHYLVHMAREEGEAMPALHARHSDDELQGVTMQIRAAVPPDEMARFLAIMIPAMHVAERASLLADMKAHAPKPAFDGVCALASDVLDSAEWTAARGRAGI